MKVKYTRDSVLPIAQSLLSLLAPSCECIEIAGSLRRQMLFVSDIELLAIPKYSYNQASQSPDKMVDLLDEALRRLISAHALDYRLNKRGSRVYGLKNKFLVHIPSSIPVDIFSTDYDCWPMSLVIRTGGQVTNQRLALAALKKRMRLHAYGSGYTLADGTHLTCYSEEEVFSAVGMPFLPPEERE